MSSPRRDFSYNIYTAGGAAGMAIDVGFLLLVKQTRCRAPDEKSATSDDRTFATRRVIAMGNIADPTGRTTRFPVAGLRRGTRRAPEGKEVTCNLRWAVV
jgi:hypothetical protein